MHDDCERSVISHFQVEGHEKENKLNIRLEISMIGVSWYLYEELVGAFRLQKDVNVGIHIEEGE